MVNAESRPATSLPSRPTIHPAQEERLGFRPAPWRACVFYDHGQVPKWFLDHFSARRVFLSVLEIIAQVLPLAAFASFLPQGWLAFIDNQAGEAALKKGYGKDDAVNGVLTAFWALAVRRMWDPDVNGVESKANISDAVSRADLQFAREQRWTRVHLPVRPIYLALARASVDIDYAVDQAAADLINISTSWPEPALSGLGGAPGG